MMPMDIPMHTMGGLIDLANLQPDHMTAFTLGDILAKINRFNGRTPQPWSVAAHSVLVEALCPEIDMKGWALLHDAHEAFIGDITIPGLELICAAGTGIAVRNAVGNAKGMLDRKIGSAWECAPRSHSIEIRRADWVACEAEMAVFFNAPVEGHAPSDRESILRACDLISELPVGSRWADARDLWILRAETLASMGLLRLPRSLAAEAA